MNERLRTLILNFKNYEAAQGDGALRLARAAETVSKHVKVRIIVAPPTPMLAQIASKVGIQVFSQSVASVIGEKTTGAVMVESVKAAGGAGTILNHSEARVGSKDLIELVPRIRRLGLKTCLCARDSREVASLASLVTDYLAVEPPELIGSGVAVSKARPALVVRSVQAARSSGYEGKVLCGAGIVGGEDVRRAVELGADGVLVSSSVVKSRDWNASIRELAVSLL